MRNLDKTLENIFGKGEKILDLFKCKICGKVLSTSMLSSKSNLCRHCFARLEELYDKLGIHNYIRRYGLAEDFKPEDLARELKIDPRTVRTLYDLGFFERDLQTYNHGAKERRRSLADEISQEVDKLKGRTRSRTERQPIVPPPPRKSPSYGGTLYRRRAR